MLLTILSIYGWLICAFVAWSIFIQMFRIKWLPYGIFLVALAPVTIPGWVTLVFLLHTSAFIFIYLGRFLSFICRGIEKLGEILILAGR